MARFLTPYELDEIYGVLSDRVYPLPTEMQSNFGTIATFGTETIDLDKISPDLRIGIYVGADIQAKTTTMRGYQTKVFYPGYWKDKATVDFRNLRKRRVGEKLSAPTSNAGKITQAIQDAMEVLDSKRVRLQEYAATQTLLFGNYTMKSELHPPVNVDLEPNIATHLTNEGTATGSGVTLVPASQGVSLGGGRANRANISGTDVTNPTTGQVIPTLGSNLAWGAASSTPIANLQSMLDASWEPITKIYMSDDAWGKLILDTKFDSLISTDKTYMSTFAVDLLPKQQSKEGLKLRGVIGAQNIPIITYNASYQATTAAATVLTKYVDAGWVVMVSNPAYGVAAYGAILHNQADLRAQEVFWHQWQEEELGKVWLSGQSSPIHLHTKINSTFAWKVM
jgi:hypothetical protein